MFGTKISDMEKVGYNFIDGGDVENAFCIMKENSYVRAFHATNWGDGTGHMTAVNKIQMWQRANGKIYYRLYTMDSARGQYIRTSMQKFYIVNRISRW